MSVVQNDDVGLTNLTERSPSCRAANSTVTQEFPNTFMELESPLPCSQHPLFVHILSQLNPFHTTHPIYLRSILILPTHLQLGYWNIVLDHSVPNPANLMWPETVTGC
jgi:hypothetical protein